MKTSAFKILAFFFLGTASLSPTSHAEENSITPDISAEKSDTENSEKAEQQPSILSKKQWKSQALLAESAVPSEIVWLDVRYPKEAEKVKVLALKTESKNSAQQGAVLIIPDKQQHSDWPELVRPLRSELPFSGWFTLSVNLPWPSLTEVPERQLPTKTSETFSPNPQAQKNMLLGSRASQANNDSPSSEVGAEASSEEVDINLAENSQDSENVENPYALRALAHVQAAADYLNAQGFQNIAIVAIGESAQLALDYIQPKVSNISDKGFAFIMISPKLPTSYNNNLESVLGKEFQAPILDIVATNRLEAQNEARERKASAQVAAIRTYSQIKLAAPNERSMQLSANKRIKTWLGKYAPGEAKSN
jgi:hypothetical protein